MAMLPDDPHGDGTYSCDDKCSAVGMAVLDTLAEGAEIVVVRRHHCHYHVYGLRADDEPTVEVADDA